MNRWQVVQISVYVWDQALVWWIYECQVNSNGPVHKMHNADSKEFLCISVNKRDAGLNDILLPTFMPSVK